MKIKSKSTKGLLTVVFAVSLSYFVWLTWQKLTDLIGDSNKAYMIVGSVVVVGLLLGFYNFEKIMKRLG